MTAGFVVIAVVIVAALAGAAAVIGSPILAVPIVIAGLLVWGIVVVLRRPEAVRDEPEHVEFTDRDRETLLPSRSEPPDHAVEAKRRSRER